MEALGDIAANAALGLQHALNWTNLYYCFLGVLLGTLLGVIPGIGVLISMSLLFPITFHLEPSAALIMLAGIYYGTTYGGSTSSILLNLPGTPANAIACLDGYPMSQQGRAGVALFMTTIASFVGGTIGIILLMAFAPVIAAYSIHFASWEYFSLMLLGLVAASTVSAGAPIKGIAMVVVGMLLGVVGTDINSGVQRLTFGVLELFEGISLIALAMAVFGISEVIVNVAKARVRADPLPLYAAHAGRLVAVLDAHGPRRGHRFRRWRVAWHGGARRLLHVLLGRKTNRTRSLPLRKGCDRGHRCARDG